MTLRVFISIVCWVALATVNASAREPNHHEGRKNLPVGERRAKSANVLGLSLAYQAPLSLEKDIPWGAGIAFTREYFIAPRAALGIVAGVRVFPSAPLHLAFGYGVSFKHYLGVGSSVEAGSGLYLRYGLLMQMNVLTDRSGVPTGHDTHLAVGYDWRAAGLFPVVEAGYHLTQVRAFDRDTLWWPYAEVFMGLRF